MHSLVLNSRPGTVLLFKGGKEEGGREKGEEKGEGGGKEGNLNPDSFRLKSKNHNIIS